MLHHGDTVIALVLLRVCWGFQAQAVAVIHGWKQAEEQRPVLLTWSPWRWISWLNPLNPPLFPHLPLSCMDAYDLIFACAIYMLGVCLYPCIMQIWRILDITRGCVGLFWAGVGIEKVSGMEVLHVEAIETWCSSERGRCSQLLVVSPWLLLVTWPAGEDPLGLPRTSRHMCCVRVERAETASWLPGGWSHSLCFFLKDQNRQIPKSDKMCSQTKAWPQGGWKRLHPDADEGSCQSLFPGHRHTEIDLGREGRTLKKSIFFRKNKMFKSKVVCKVKCSVSHICVTAKIIQCHSFPLLAALTFKTTGTILSNQSPSKSFHEKKRTYLTYFEANRI